MYSVCLSDMSCCNRDVVIDWGFVLSTVVQCESKKSPGWKSGWKFVVLILHAYSTFLSALGYKCIFSYLQL